MVERKQGPALAGGASDCSSAWSAADWGGVGRPAFGGGPRSGITFPEGSTYGSARTAKESRTHTVSAHLPSIRHLYYPGTFGVMCLYQQSLQGRKYRHLCRSSQKSSPSLLREPRSEEQPSQAKKFR